MSFSGRMDRAFQNALRLPLNCRTRYILLSDCHRGTGNANDNFQKNEFLYLAALDYYFRENFICLELGDGDELWENRSIERIKEAHRESFEMLARFYEAGRLYLIYGNHDMVKKNPTYRDKYFRTYFCDQELCERPLCPGVRFYSGIILKDQEKKQDIYLTHGHQADLLNSTFWRVSRFLVRYIWRPLESLGIPDPTSAAKNNTRKKESEKKLSGWADRHGHILITGHTHHPMITDSGYLNTGSCVHPSGITGIEIRNRCLTLVKWSVAARQDLSLYARREILGEPVRLP